MKSRIDNLEKQLADLAEIAASHATKHNYQDYFNTLRTMHDYAAANRIKSWWGDKQYQATIQFFIHWSTAFLTSQHKSSSQEWAMIALNTLLDTDSMESSLDDPESSTALLEDIQKSLYSTLKKDNTRTAALNEQLAQALVIITLGLMGKIHLAKQISEDKRESKSHLIDSVLAGLTYLDIEESKEVEEAQILNFNHMTIENFFSPPVKRSVPEKKRDDHNDIDLAIALSLSEVKPQHFTWKIENKDNFTFELTDILADGECAFSAMNIGSRSTISNTLLDANTKKLEKIRTLIAPEIKTQFLGGNLKGILQDDTQLKDIYEDLTKEFGEIESLHATALRAGKKQLEEKVSSNIGDNLSDLAAQLKKYSTEETAKRNDYLIDELSKLITRKTALDEKLTQFCLDLTVQNQFIRKYVSSKGSWLAYQPNSSTSMDAIAELHGLCLLIFMKNEKNELKLMHRYTSESTEPTRVAALLYTHDGHYHFDRLTIEPSLKDRFYTYLNIKTPSPSAKVVSPLSVMSKFSESKEVPRKNNGQEIKKNSNELEMALDYFHMNELTTREKIAIFEDLQYTHPSLQTNVIFIELMNTLTQERALQRYFS